MQMNVDEMIAAAKARAAQSPAPQTGAALTPAPQTAQPYQPPATAMARPSLTSLMTSTSVSVDAFLKVSDFGLTVGSDKEIVEPFEAVMSLADVRPCMQLRFGKPVEYHKTLDGITTMEGRSWTEVLALAKRVDPSKRTDPFQTADLVIRTKEPVRGTRSKAVKVEAGKALGHTPSYTGVEKLRDMLKAVAASGRDPETAVVLVKIDSEARNNKDGNNWGVVTYELQGFVEN